MLGNADWSTWPTLANVAYCLISTLDSPSTYGGGTWGLWPSGQVIRISHNNNARKRFLLAKKRAYVRMLLQRCSEFGCEEVRPLALPHLLLPGAVAGR